MSLRSPITRAIGFLLLGLRRLGSQVFRSRGKRIRYTITGVAAAIALLVVITGISLGLATSTTVYDDDIDYWVVSGEDTVDSPLVDTNDPQFAGVHDAHDAIAAIDGVDTTTPVLSYPYSVESASESDYALVHGIIDTPDRDSFLGIDTDPLPEYPAEYSQNDTSNIAVLSATTSNLLNATVNDTIEIANDEYTVVGVDDDATGGFDEVPIIILPLSDLQVATGAHQADLADQFVVETTDPDVASDIADIYPDAEIESRSSLTANALFDQDMALGLALTAGLVATVVGVLFVGTASGLEVASSRSILTTLSAVGISTRSQLSFIAVQTLGMSIIGGVLGALGGVAGIWLLNHTTAYLYAIDSVAFFHHLLIPYGIIVAIIVGLLALPAVLLFTRRISGGVPQ